MYLGTDRWELRLCELSCAPGTFKPSVVVDDTHALIYCTLIYLQFVGEQKVAFTRTYIHPRAFCNQVFKKAKVPEHSDKNR